MVAGNNLVNNHLPPSDYMFLYDRFDTWGVVEPGYVHVVTAGANQAQVLGVTVWNESTDIMISGEMGTPMEVAPFIMVGEDRMYVPIRFVSEALQVPTERIIFDDLTKRAVISTPERIIAFEADSSAYWINGIELTMTENGVTSYAMIDPVTERMMIPFRFLAYALNVDFEWDDYEKSVTFNPHYFATQWEQ